MGPSNTFLWSHCNVFQELCKVLKMQTWLRRSLSSGLDKYVKDSIIQEGLAGKAKWQQGVWDQRWSLQSGQKAIDRDNIKGRTTPRLRLSQDLWIQVASKLVLTTSLLEYLNNKHQKGRWCLTQASEILPPWMSLSHHIPPSKYPFWRVSGWVFPLCSGACFFCFFFFCIKYLLFLFF